MSTRAAEGQRSRWSDAGGAQRGKVFYNGGMATTVEQIHTALASAYPLIVVLSPEEDRIERLIQRFAAGAKPQPLPVVTWNCLDGLAGQPGTEDPIAALRWLETQGPRGFYVFKDLQALLPGNRPLLRRLRDTAAAIRNTGRFLFLLAPEVRGRRRAEAAHLRRDLAVPRRERGQRDVVAAVLQQAGRTAEPDRVQILIGSLRGMSPARGRAPAAPPARSPPDVDDGVHGRGARREGAGDAQGGDPGVRPPDPRASTTSAASTSSRPGCASAPACSRREAMAQGLPRPKGVLLMGMSGCGKSLAVKVIATEWKLPLFRLDMNLVFAGVQGSPEWVFHRALEAVEAVAPAVLWIDEIEMGVAGLRARAQTGSMTRIFSTFLTWMQEHRADVFVAATANRINLLPAEIIRKGRFDQVFFVELPNEEERKEILGIHMRGQALDPGRYDLVLLASADARLERRGDRAGGGLGPHRLQRREPPRRGARPADRDGADRAALDHDVRADQGDPLVGAHPRAARHHSRPAGDVTPVPVAISSRARGTREGRLPRRLAARPPGRRPE